MNKGFVIRFEDYCGQCQYRDEKPSPGNHCERCLSQPYNEYTSVPAEFVQREDIYDGPEENS